MEKVSFYKRAKTKLLKAIVYVKGFAAKEDGFGMNEILGIAMGLMLVAFVIFPGLKTLTEDIMAELLVWWENVTEVITS